MLYQVHLVTMLGTDCKGISKSIYHTITATTAPTVFVLPLNNSLYQFILDTLYLYQIM